MQYFSLKNTFCVLPLLPSLFNFITKTCLCNKQMLLFFLALKIENFQLKKKIDMFLIFLLKTDCGYTQCKRGFKGYTLHGHIFVMLVGTEYAFVFNHAQMMHFFFNFQLHTYISISDIGFFFSQYLV